MSPASQYLVLGGKWVGRTLERSPNANPCCRRNARGASDSRSYSLGGTPHHICDLPRLPDTARLYPGPLCHGCPHPSAGESPCSLCCPTERGRVRPCCLVCTKSAHSLRTVPQTTQQECEGVWSRCCNLSPGGYRRGTGLCWKAAWAVQ